MAESVRGRSSPPWLGVALLAWPVLLAVALLWPLLAHGGHPLGRDLVFPPQQPLTWSAAGLADGSPRAVPLDAVVALLTTVIDGGALARILLLAILVLAAAGVMRSLPWVGPVGLLVAAGVAVWNPFVVERLALGQWALLTSYAALPWLVRAAAASADRTPRRLGALAPVVGWAALASLTPTGGLLALAVVTVQVVLRRKAAAMQLLAVLLLQAPWVVAGLVGSSATVSDPAGVAAFAPDTEGRFGTLVALLGLGGIWDAGSEPFSRTTVLAPVTALAVVVVLVLAGRGLHRRLVAPVTWWVLGIGGLSYALVLATGPGQAGLRVLVAHVPAAGLLRDAQKFLLPTALLVALAAGVAADLLVRLLARRVPDAVEVRLVLMVPAIVAPLLLLPDGARLVWQTVDPVRFPESSYAEVDRITSGSGRAVAMLPWRAYRRFSWGHGLTSSDPATRVLRAPTVVSDDLQVGSRLVRGEGALAGQIGDILERGGDARDLGALGIGWVVVYPDDPDAGTVDVDGLVPTYADSVLTLYAVPDSVPFAGPPLIARALLAAAYALVVVMLAAAVVRSSRQLRRQRR
ncbi:hypothetical protein [Nocardioides sp.]|uniref:hypothetical protein n=1 Tax=Nocardioides sp. TaxID=35761 RepID=UPI002628F532|nr:hypothetical protein [Nocardioides sp.]MCW2736538.1 hypothetical protein [Nocardioides sp.]